MRGASQLYHFGRQIDVMAWRRIWNWHDQSRAKLPTSPGQGVERALRNTQSESLNFGKSSILVEALARPAAPLYVGPIGGNPCLSGWVSTQFRGRMGALVVFKDQGRIGRVPGTR
jgi:hypothetical protein